MKANIEIQGTDDGGLDHCGSIEAVEKGECYIQGMFYREINGIA